VREGAEGLAEGSAEDVEGVPTCTYGADLDDRGKFRGKAAVSVARAIDLLDSGDVDGARSVLAALVELR
jgi:hypothetical protein